MLFSRRGPEIILINVYNSLTFAALEGELTSSTIKRVIEMHNMKKTKEFKKLQANYDKIKKRRKPNSKRRREHENNFFRRRQYDFCKKRNRGRLNDACIESKSDGGLVRY